MVVAEFIIQTETAAYIQEAHTVKNGSLTFFMCDYSEAESLSL